MRRIKIENKVLSQAHRLVYFTLMHGKNNDKYEGVFQLQENQYHDNHQNLPVNTIYHNFKKKKTVTFWHALKKRRFLNSLVNLF